MSKTMKAAVFVEPGRIELRAKPIPEIGPDDALASTGNYDDHLWNRHSYPRVTFENALKVLRPAATLSSVGIYPHDLCFLSALPFWSLPSLILRCDPHTKFFDMLIRWGRTGP
jgi:threonine dehydrogenase-like Zn-dependent dehydrogenase